MCVCARECFPQCILESPNEAFVGTGKENWKEGVGEIKRRKEKRRGGGRKEKGEKKKEIREEKEREKGE